MNAESFIYIIIGAIVLLLILFRSKEDNDYIILDQMEEKGFKEEPGESAIKGFIISIICLIFGLSIGAILMAGSLPHFDKTHDWGTGYTKPEGNCKTYDNQEFYLATGEKAVINTTICDRAFKDES